MPPIITFVVNGRPPCTCEIGQHNHIKRNCCFSYDDDENETIYRAIENCMSSGELSYETKGGKRLDITWTIEEGIGWQTS